MWPPEDVNLLKKYVLHMIIDSFQKMNCFSRTGKEAARFTRRE